MRKIYPVVLLVAGSLFAYSQSQIFTTSGNFVVPTGVTSVTIAVIGAGGTGGTNGGGGGGGGGYAAGIYAVTPNATLPVTIGTGGSGSVGGTSSVSTFLSATGGANGTTVPNPSVGGGGAGGSGAGGNIVNRTGGNGGGAYYTYFGGGGGGAGGPLSNGTNGGNTIVYTSGNCLTPGGSAGTNGGPPAGNGGKGAGFTNNGCTATDPAAGGSLYGGGGGGGNGIGSAAGVGANGYAQIAWGAGTCTAPAAPSNVTPSANLTFCGPFSTTLMATSSGSVIWYNGATGTGVVGTGTTFITPSLNNTTSVPSYSTFYAEAFTCTNSAVRTPVTVTINPPPTLFLASTSTAVCTGSQVTLTAGGGVSYTWAPYNSAQMTFSTGATTTVTPAVTTVYTLTGVASTGCTNTATTMIAVNPLPVITVFASNNSICAGNTATLTASGAFGFGWLPFNPATMTVVVPSGLIVKPTGNSTYSVVGADLNGCFGMSSISINVNPLPVMSISSSKTLICSGETVSITASGATSYLWNTNATSSVITVSPAANTNYSVTGTDNGCSKLASYTQSVTICTGINTDLASENQLLVYPNPSNGEFSIRSDKYLKASLCNELGQLIRTFILDSGNKYTVTLKNIRAGIYFVHGDEDKLLFRQKIIVTD